MIPGQKPPVHKNRHKVFFNPHAGDILNYFGRKNPRPLQAAPGCFVKRLALVKKLSPFA
jgi:hypothetical protein